jgi:transposase
MKVDKSRKKCDRQFKIDAVSLVVNGERSVTEVTRDLGIEANVLHRWKRELVRKQSETFPGEGRLRALIVFGRSWLLTASHKA